ncbi:hypothetical protein [Pelagicoccus mobilis]|uniref:Uncharacterized protein n=1 Tax=Pelagicoccus mobilis TaxID=415221 RepID=A0A934RVN0_9BACT|nr:hypothetical protein [Pelagicoccus mobilis]MBK1877228.1 hypothetical protein [Pelagicoccus mobilis]
MANLIHDEPDKRIRQEYYGVLLVSGSNLAEKIIEMAESIEDGVLDLRE